MKIEHRELLLDRENPVPMYYQISQSLERVILDNSLRKGDRFLPERELSKLFRVETATIRKATDLLVGRNILVREERRGTFVRDPDRLQVKTKDIGFVILKGQLDRKHNPLFWYTVYRIHEALASYCQTEGYFVKHIMVDVNLIRGGNKAEIDMALKTIKNSGVSGVIIIDPCEPLFRRMTEEKFHFVSFDYQPRPSPYDMICMNIEKAMHAAVGYLKELGHRKMAYIVFSHSDEEIYRAELFRKTLCAQSLEFDERQIIDTSKYIGKANSYEVMKELLKEGKPDFTAIVCDHTFMALNVIRALTEDGYRVPGDISVISGNNNMDPQGGMIQVTTIEKPLDRLGIEAGKLLIRHIEEPNGRNENIIFECELNKGKTCGRI